MSDVVRTPEERFIDVPDMPWAPNYTENLPGYEGLRMHLLDEGPPRSGEVYFCLHGEPTWSFLYRKMIPVFLGDGGRVVAPDFFGFGRSDKPVDDAVYTFDFHRNCLLELIEQRNLQNLTLVCQDWGGILGLTLPMEMPERFDRIIVMNTMLGVGDATASAGFVAWRQFVRDNPDFPIGALMKRAAPGLTEREAAAYEAPFPDDTYKAGVRRFPEIVPDRADAAGAKLSRHALDWLENAWQGPTFMAVGLQDPVLAAPMPALAAAIHGCPEPLEVEDGGHFLQESGAPVAQAALEYFARPA